jgi:cytochrome c oxidase assembly factor CtaG
MRVTSLGLAIVVYALGLWRLWRFAGYGQGIRPTQALAFASGWLSLVVALSPPLDGWSDEWLAAHMVQHELLMVVAAPLIAYGGPVIGLLWAMPARLRRAAVTSVRRSGLAHAWNVLTMPGCVFVLYGVALWVWHIPVLYDYAVEHEGVHVVQHLCFFGTATLFWWGITHGRQGRAGYGAAVVYVFVTAVHGAVLGALLTVSPRVWYAPYLLAHPDGLTPLEDQQLAGLLMWVPAGLAFAAGGLFLFAAWLHQSDRRSRFAPDASTALTSIRTL